MTEKRFTLTFDDNIVDNLTGITHNVHSGYDVAMDLTGLLNALHEENIKLKEQLLENNCDNCVYSEAIYVDVKCRKKGYTEWEWDCSEFKEDLE